jgi:two-component system sensor histidine kinase MtrB
VSAWLVHARLRVLHARLRVLRAVRGPAAHWRTSLQLRVVLTSLVVGLVAVTVLGGLLASRIQDGLVSERIGEVLRESARGTSYAQSTFDQARPSTAADIQQRLYDVPRDLQSRGSGRPEVFFFRSPSQGSPVLVNDTATNQDLVALVSPGMRSAVQRDSAQQWQPVAIPPGRSPGAVVGSVVTIPGWGSYELYYLYDLSPEQSSLDLVQRTLGGGAIGLVALLGFLTWLVTRQAVQPIRSAAGVAERLADGLLDERMVVRGQDEIATLARSFNAMAESLQDQIRRMERLSRMQRRFVSDVSHELRTPLTTIRMAGEVIYASRGGFDPAIARSAELLTTQIDRFEALLADLLEISRFDAGAAALDVEEHDVRDIVTRAIDQAAPLAERRQVWLGVTFPEERCAADIDPRRIERVLRNLLVNAIDHAAEGTPVEIEVAADRTSVAVRVRDHGPGLTQDEAEHVFDRFWRADPARSRSTGGTGLGLAISLEDARLHGGWLHAWGQPGGGASFRLTLPRRAGIVLTESPLPLVPETTGPIPSQDDSARRRIDPAGLPDFDTLEAR